MSTGDAAKEHDPNAGVEWQDTNLLGGYFQDVEVKYLTPRQLMIRSFLKNRLAVFGMFILLMFYIGVILAEFIAPYNATSRFNRFVYAPPRVVHLVDAEGYWHFPFVYALESTVDRTTFQRTFVENTDERYPVGLLVQGEPYRLLGLFQTDIHLIGIHGGNPDTVGPLYLLGSDNFGRDLFSRILYGSRISLTIGLIGVGFSLVIGLILGGLSGLYGGIIDHFIQRLIEFIRSMPTIPLWMALAAALPPDWPQLQMYFGVTIILSFVGWTTLARVVRGKFLSLRDEDFVYAARQSGAGEWYIIWQHLIPSFMSYILVYLTLAIPGMLLGETALSFLGLGLTPPTISWGVLLRDSQQVQAIALYPWLLSPALFVILAVLAFNFVGDGLRDAADPYAGRS